MSDIPSDLFSTEWLRGIYAALLAGCVLVAWYWTRNRQASILRRDDRNAIAFAAFVGCMLGSKLPFILDSNWGVAPITLWFADGKTILGGIFGGYASVELIKWLRGIRQSTGDSFALPIALTIGVGRVGCFIAGCCYGIPTQLPWGVNFHVVEDAPDTLRHPTQLYETAFHFLAVGWLALAERYNWFRNHRLKVYLICYLVFRFVTEWVRPQTPILFDLTLYQYASVAGLTLIVLHWYTQIQAPRGKAH